MVYRGKLSKACAECRAKKTRCDAARPTCGQCRRAGRTCSGYRNLQELRLVDQSSEVTSKLSKQRRQSTHHYDSGYETVSQGTDSPPSATSPPGSVEAVGNKMALTFPEPAFWINSNAKNAFFAEYIDIGAAFLKTDLQFVSPIHSAARTDGMLENIISALGMAVLMKSNHDITYLATQKYSTAIRQTRAALKDPKLAKADETLATVLLLGLHELVAMDEPSQKAEQSSIHLDGAVRILQLRGPSQLKSIHAARMFHKVYLEVFMNSLYNRTRIPPGMVKLARAARQHLNSGETTAADLFEIAARLCDILASPQPAYREKLLARLFAVMAIDDELLAWRNALDHYFEYQKIPIQDPNKSFLTYQDNYINHLSGAAWNRYRCIRIVLHEEIISLLASFSGSPGSPGSSEVDVSAILASSKSTVTEMSVDICQSAPFFLGQSCLQDWKEDDSRSPSMYGGAAMLMPLYFASNPDRISPAMFRWLLSQIERIGKDTGIARARNMVKERTQMLGEGRFEELG